MNTKSLLTKGAVVAGSFGLLATLGATAASASTQPATATVVASTHETNVPDTTSGTATSQSSPGGPVWARDDVTKTFRVTPTGVTPGGLNTYTVTETVNGTFTAFDEPNTATAADIAAGIPGPEVALNPNVTGQMHGTNTYTVTSNVAPDAAGLPALVNDQNGTANGGNGYSTSDLITDLFGGPANAANVQVGGGDNWVFAYHAAGGSMTQAWNTPTTAWGNITG